MKKSESDLAYLICRNVGEACYCESGGKHPCERYVRTAEAVFEYVKNHDTDTNKAG